MHVIVCVKQVPETTNVQIDPVRGTLIRDGVSSVVNPFDLHAIEEGLRLKERYGGQVTAITMGPQSAIEVLEYAIAMGCDEGVLLSDPAFAGADTWATAYTLTQAIHKIGNYDIVICGRQAVDGDTGQVGPSIAAQLGISLITYTLQVCSINPKTCKIRAERLVEGGREIIESTLPCLLTVLKDINEPRSLNFSGIRKAKMKNYPVWTARNLCESAGADISCFGLQGSPTRVTSISTPSRNYRNCRIISTDDDVEKAEILAGIILDEGI